MFIGKSANICRGVCRCLQGGLPVYAGKLAYVNRENVQVFAGSLLVLQGSLHMFTGKPASVTKGILQIFTGEYTGAYIRFCVYSQGTL